MPSKQPSERLQLTLFKLKSLLDFSLYLGSDSSPKHVLHHFEQLLYQELGINRILFYTLEDEAWELQLNTHYPAELLHNVDVGQRLRAYTHPAVVTSKRDGFLDQIDVIIPLEEDGKVCGYALLGDTRDQVRGVSPVIRHMAFAQTLAMITFIALQNQRRLQAVLLQKKMEQEFNTAANLQRMLIPDSHQVPVLPGVEIAAFYQPHFELGGDYYDFFLLDHHRLCFCIADVSGKGIAAALVMTNFQANFRAFMRTNVPLDELVVWLNRIVYKNTDGERFITFFVGIYDQESGLLEYVNAGHNTPFLYDWDTHTLAALPSLCPGLGMVEELPKVKAQRIAVAGLQGLLLYTDGLVERKHGTDVVADDSTIRRELADNRHAQALIDIIAQRLQREQDTHQLIPFDDISAVALYFDNTSPHAPLDA